MSNNNKRRRVEKPIVVEDAGTDAHRGRVLVYLALNPRKEVAFNAKCFLMITEVKFIALVESLASGNPDDKTVLRSYEFDDLECPLRLEELKYSVHHDANPAEYMTFYTFVTEKLQETFETGDALTIVI